MTEVNLQDDLNAVNDASIPLPFVVNPLIGLPLLSTLAIWYVPVVLEESVWFIILSIEVIIELFII